MCLSACLSAYLVYFYLPIYLSTYLSIHLSIHPSIYLILSYPNFSYLLLSASILSYLSVCLSICLSIRLSIYLSICLSVCLPSLSVCLSINQSIYSILFYSNSNSNLFYSILFYPWHSQRFVLWQLTTNSLFHAPCISKFENSPINSLTVFWFGSMIQHTLRSYSG